MTTSSTCRTLPPTLRTSTDLESRLDIGSRVFSLFRESKLGLWLAAGRVVCSPSFNPTNLTAKSSHTRLAPILSLTVTLPEMFSPNGFTKSRNPPVKPLEFSKSSVSGLASTAICGAKARWIRFLISGEPTVPGPGDEDRPSTPDKTVVPVRPPSVVGVEEPLRIDPASEDVEA